MNIFGKPDPICLRFSPLYRWRGRREIKIYVVFLSDHWKCYQKDVIHVDLLVQTFQADALGKRWNRKSGGTISRTLCEYLTHTHSLSLSHTRTSMPNWRQTKPNSQPKTYCSWVFHLQPVGKYLSKWPVV